MTPMKRMLFGVSATALSALLVFTALLGLDLYLHKRFEGVAGLNSRGYRGAVVKRKQPGEQRLVVLGGSTALGYGVPPSDSFPVRLQEKLQTHRRQTHRGPVSVVNIAYNSEGAYAFIYNLRFYDSLDYDVALFYTGYNDLGGHNTTVIRNQSPIFRLTGYYPILPLIFREKAMALRYGNVEAGYWAERRGEPVVFRPNLARRSAASVLEASVKMSQALEQQLARLTKDSPDQSGSSEEMGCGTWNQYCRSLYVAVDEVLHRGKWAVVVTEPYLGDGHMEQQRIMAGMLQREFGDHPRLRYSNLGDTVDLKDPTLCYDGMHLTAIGNERIAEALVQPILETLQ